MLGVLAGAAPAVAFRMNIREVRAAVKLLLVVAFIGYMKVKQWRHANMFATSFVLACLLELVKRTVWIYDDWRDYYLG